MWFSLPSLFLTAALTATAPLPLRPPPHRVALVVGANDAAPGRANLRFAHQDAQAMAAALVEVGQFQASDVEVLLDPAPDQLVEAMDQRLAGLRSETGETLFLFYYSGHADDRSLYPQGKPLPLSMLRQRLEQSSPTVRIGIIDACRGGAWTRAKGLTADAPFDVQLPMALATEGSVLIASSSGLESAHESDALEGSFFTHYFIAGMRGAATQAIPGTVTLGEIFSYAQERTVRDTALQLGIPQHPSFSINLKGRSDLTLATLNEGISTVALRELHGPLQLIDAANGVALLELPAGERDVKLAVPPGHYFLRRAEGTVISVAEVSVEAGQTVAVDEGSLTAAGEPVVASKSEPTGAPWWRSVLQANVPISVGDGVSVGGSVSGTYYFEPLLNDSREPVDALELLQRRDSVSFGVGLLRLDGALGWSGELGARVYPWGATGLTASASVASAPGTSALQTSFSLGVSRYLGDGLRVDVGYRGTRQLEGSPVVPEQSVLFDTWNYNGGYANVSWLLPSRFLRLGAEVSAGDVDVATASSSLVNGFEGKLSVTGTLYLSRAWSLNLEASALDYHFHDSTVAPSTVYAAVGAGVTRYFTGGLALSANATGGYTAALDNSLELQPGATLTLGISKRF